jgi:hypothetical protein
MARRSPQTQAKRERELAKAKKRQDKLARREQRKALREQGPTSETADNPSVEPEEASTDDPAPT